VTNHDAGYDIIGDVHGCANELEELLLLLGYEERNGAYWHPTRQAIFVGDLIDRGPRQIDSVNIARSMADSGAALIVAANHEFNAIAWATPAADRPSGWLRNRETKAKQHQAFVDAVRNESRLHGEIIDWFRTLPLWLELDGLRVVHACWDAANIEWLASQWGPTPMGDLEFMRRATDKVGAPREYVAIEHLLKGPEVPITPSYLDKGGTERHDARMNWWNAERSRDDTARLGDVVHIPGGTITSAGEPYQLADPDQRAPMPVAPYDRVKPVFFGHYWFSGEPRIEGPSMACTDWSCVKGGTLAAYRWSGESELTNDNWISVPSQQA